MIGTTRKSPDFVIAGAPKCGTTALYDALRLHPELTMSWLKEPNYFATDIPGCREVTDEKEYESLFRDPDRSKLRGESSVFYLQSPFAIPALLERRPDIKVIAVVRNPIELYHSLHNQRVKSLEEDRLDPRAAWEMQERRAQGLEIPVACQEPIILQYRETVLLGRQVKRLMELVPESQRLIIVYDDLRSDPAGCLQRIYRFLEISATVSIELPQSNEYAVPKNLLIASMIHRVQTHPILRRIQFYLKPLLNRVGLEPIVWLSKRNLRRVRKPELAPEFRTALAAEFTEDVRLLSSLVGRNLDHWLRPVSR